MHRASYFEPGPYAAESHLQGSWVDGSDAKKSKKSWGERLRLGGGGGTPSKEERKLRERDMAVDMLQSKFYLQEYRDRYGSVTPATAATILQEGAPNGPMRFSNHWSNYGSVALRPHPLLVHQPPSRHGAFRTLGEEEVLRTSHIAPPGNSFGPRVLCPCGGGGPEKTGNGKSSGGTRRGKKGAQRNKGCALCGGGGTVRLPTRNVPREVGGTVVARGTQVLPGGTLHVPGEVPKRPTLEGLFAASAAGAATVHQPRALFERPVASPPAASSAVDPYDVMRRTRLVRPPEHTTARMRSKSSSPNRGLRNRRRRPWGGTREWPSEGEEDEDSGEDALSRWEDDEEDAGRGGGGAGRKSILECEVSAYELLTKYLKKGGESPKTQVKRLAPIPSGTDDALSMDELSDDLSDNALEDDTHKARVSRGGKAPAKPGGNRANKSGRERNSPGVRVNEKRLGPEGYGSEGEEVRPTRPPRRSRAPAKSSQCPPLHSPPPPPPPPMPPPPPPTRSPALMPPSTIKSILKKTTFVANAAGSVPGLESQSSSSSLGSVESQPSLTLRINNYDEPRRVRKDTSKKQVQFKATHDVVTLQTEEEGPEEVGEGAEKAASVDGPEEGLRFASDDVEKTEEVELQSSETSEKSENEVEESAKENEEKTELAYEVVSLLQLVKSLVPPQEDDSSAAAPSPADRPPTPKSEVSEVISTTDEESSDNGYATPKFSSLPKLDAKIPEESLNATDLCRTNALRHSLDERPDPGRSREGMCGGGAGADGSGAARAGATLFNDTMRLRLKVHRPEARRAFAASTPLASQKQQTRARMLSPPPRPREPPPPPPPTSPGQQNTPPREAADEEGIHEDSRARSRPRPLAPPRQIFPFTPDEIRRINGEGRRWSARLHSENGRQRQTSPAEADKKTSRPLSWSPPSRREDTIAVTVVSRETTPTLDQKESESEGTDEGDREGGRTRKVSRTVVTLGSCQDTVEEHSPKIQEDDLKLRVRVEQVPKKTSIIIGMEQPQVINRKDDNTLTISVAGGTASPCGVYVAQEEEALYETPYSGDEDEKTEDRGTDLGQERSPVPAESLSSVSNLECLLVDPVEAIRRNLVPHVCGKDDEDSATRGASDQEKDSPEEEITPDTVLLADDDLRLLPAESFEKDEDGDREETEDAPEASEESATPTATEMTATQEISTADDDDPADEDVEEDEEEDHYESVSEPIYEEIGGGEKGEEKSIFEGASKYDILSYLVGARARGIPLDSEFDSLGLEEDLLEDDFEEEEEDDEEDLVIPLSLRNVGCRASHLSDSSEDSRATPSPLASLHSVTPQDKRRSSAEIERNDSGVGSETSKSSRSRWQHQQQHHKQKQPKGAAAGSSVGTFGVVVEGAVSRVSAPPSNASSSASTLSSSSSAASTYSSSGGGEGSVGRSGRTTGRPVVLEVEEEDEDEEAGEGSGDGGEGRLLSAGDEDDEGGASGGNGAERHLCEDCDQPVETQVTDGGLMFAPLVCRKCGKRRSERREIIAEIVETEAKYGRDLRILLEEFERPMRVAGLLSSEQLAGIFLNTAELATASSVLVGRLKDALEIAVENGDEDLLTVNVGKVFLDAAPTMLHAFQSYCTRQGAASLLLSNLEKEKELLRVFLRVSQMENAVLRRMNLNSFLMVPVQRVTKYPLLLGRLFKVTPHHAEGRDLLRQAQRKIELHLEHMNAETKDMSAIRLWRRISIINGTPGRRSNSEMDMQTIRLKKLALDVLEWNPDKVRFPVEGKLHYTQPTDSKWRKGQTVKLTSVNALLVTHGKLKEDCNLDLSEPMLMFPRDTGIKEAALVLVKEKCNRYSLLREPMYLDRCIICKEMDWDDCFEVQELSTKDTYIFKGESLEVTRQWYQELQYHALGLGPWRKRRNALANIMINSMARN
ncbi:uncharacterized protein LOC124163642 [Ischnura elegans]|uniref:uncharacterized protein LOC124163642 n=1 Tax=Ischnura elegans TaxID=197161 RepID=UPI001ED8950D|nr:uncharacterized protein LOC124163642 [Ischnura elegans]